MFVDTSRKYRNFEGFGASGAWWAQLVGGWPCRDEIVRLLYSPDDGIGLTAYRYNIGAGSARSGLGDIGNPLRRTDCFETAPGRYDFDRDREAVSVLRAAVRYGAKEVVFFVNSPPERLTVSGMAHCDRRRPFRNNLPRGNEAAFADFCLDVTEHFVREGLPVKYLSPINEPLWVWNGGQEGCHYSPAAAARVMGLIARKMDDRPALRDVKLSGFENGDVRWFNRTYTRYLFRDPAVSRRAPGVDVHSYFLNPGPIPILNDRAGFLRRFRRWMERRYPDKTIRMSEWCHMQGGRDSSMASALVMARVIWEDLTILNASAWQHWIAVSEVDYCDGLIYIDPETQTYSLTKRYYATGNFSKYIPVGAVRVRAETRDKALLACAFAHPDGLTAVVVNETAQTRAIDLPENAYLAVVTDDAQDLAEHPISGRRLTLTPRSVTTILCRKEDAS